MSRPSEVIFHTFEMRQVHIVKGEILSHARSAGCAVNPCVYREGQGVSGNGFITTVFNRHGGVKYKRERRKAVPRHDTCCVITDGGDLGFKVLHQTRMIDQKATNEEIENEVFTSVTDCLWTADEERMVTVVFPCVYAGNSNVIVCFLYYKVMNCVKL